MTYISKIYTKRIQSLHSEGFGLEELAIMYRTTTSQIERVLERWEDL